MVYQTHQSITGRANESSGKERKGKAKAKGTEKGTIERSIGNRRLLERSRGKGINKKEKLVSNLTVALVSDLVDNKE